MGAQPDTEQRVLCLAARSRLDDAASAQLAELLERVDWERLWHQAGLHEVAGLVAATLAGFAGVVEIPSEWSERARRRTSATLIQNRLLQRELVELLGALDGAGVDATPVKGVVLAHAVYDGLSLRPTADLDVVVQPPDLQRARDVVAALGFRPAAEAPFEARHHPYHDPQYYRPTVRGEVCLELHHALWAARFWDDDGGWWQRRVPMTIDGLHARVLSPEDTLVHLAIHRARSPLRLRHLVDIAELVRRPEPALQWPLVLRAAHATSSRTALYASLSLSARLLGAPVARTALDELRVGPVKRRVVARTCGASALFRDGARSDDDQQPLLALRAFEQDGALRIASTLAHAVARKAHKLLDRTRRATARDAAPAVSSGAGAVDYRNGIKRSDG